MSRGHGRAQRWLLARMAQLPEDSTNYRHTRLWLYEAIPAYVADTGCSESSADASLRRAAKRLQEEGLVVTGYGGHKRGWITTPTLADSKTKCSIVNT